MHNLINFSDFYQKPLIPIGEKDRLSVQPTSPFENRTHWLIALVGSEKEKGSEIYQWRVFVFHSDSSGYVNYNLPYFISPFFHLYNEAFEYSKLLETMAFEDQLISIAN